MRHFSRICSFDHEFPLSSYILRCPPPPPPPFNFRSPPYDPLFLPKKSKASVEESIRIDRKSLYFFLMYM